MLYETGVAHALCVPVILYGGSDSKRPFDISDQRMIKVAYNSNDLLNDAATVADQTGKALIEVLDAARLPHTPVTNAARAVGWTTVYARPLRAIAGARRDAFGGSYARSDPWVELARLNALLPLEVRGAHAGTPVVDTEYGSGTLVRCVREGGDVDLTVRFDTGLEFSERRPDDGLRLWTHGIRSRSPETSA